MKKGVPVSPGVAVARAYCLDQALVGGEPHQLDVTALAAELNRLDAACAAAGRELDKAIARIAAQVGEDEAAIFRAHRALLRDPALIGKVKAVILNRHVEARTALRECQEEYAALFAQIHDEYLKERMADIRDVIGRLASHLALEEQQRVFEANEPVILVAEEILPSQALTFDRFHV